MPGVGRNQEMKCSLGLALLRWRSARPTWSWPYESAKIYEEMEPCSIMQERAAARCASTFSAKQITSFVGSQTGSSCSYQLTVWRDILGRLLHSSSQVCRTMLRGRAALVVQDVVLFASLAVTAWAFENSKRSCIAKIGIRNNVAC